MFKEHSGSEITIVATKKKEQSPVILDLCLRNTSPVKSHNCRDKKKQQSSVIVDLCLMNTSPVKSHNLKCRDIIVYENLRF